MFACYMFNLLIKDIILIKVVVDIQIWYSLLTLESLNFQTFKLSLQITCFYFKISPYLHLLKKKLTLKVVSFVTSENKIILLINIFPNVICAQIIISFVLPMDMSSLRFCKAIFDRLKHIQGTIAKPRCQSNFVIAFTWFLN